MQARRKVESTSSRRAPGWLSSRPSFRGDLMDDESSPSINKEDVSQTQTNSTVSSYTQATPSAGVEGFELPNWEQPNFSSDAVSSKKNRVKPVSNSAAPMRKPPASPKRILDAGSPTKSAPRLDQNRPRLVRREVEEEKQPAELLQDRRPSGFENMVVTLDNSNSSLQDDITFLGDESVTGGDYAHRPGGHHVDHRRSSHQQELSAEEEKEHQLMLLAMERSMQDERVSSSQRSRKPPPQSSAPRQDMGSSDGAKFVWKKGPNGRYRKVPVGGNVGLGQVMENEAYSLHSQNASLASSNRPRSDESVARMEEEMLRQAMEQSRIDVESLPPPTSRSSQADLEREHQLMEVAMQRSLQESNRANAGRSDERYEHYERGPHDPRDRAYYEPNDPRDPRDQGYPPRDEYYHHDPRDMGPPRGGYDDYQRGPEPHGGYDAYNHSGGYDDRGYAPEPAYGIPSEMPHSSDMPRRSHRRASMGNRAEPPTYEHRQPVDPRSQMQRSGSMRSMGISVASRGSRGSSARIGFLHQPDPVQAPPVRSMSGDGSAVGKGFEWRRGPNGRFIKVPVQLETETERLARIEREMLEEAMARSREEV